MRNGITIFFEPELDERLKRFDAAVYSSMLADSTKARIKEVVQSRCDQITEGVSRDIMVRLLGDENPLARYHAGLITNEEREKYTRVVTEKLISGDISIPDRMAKLVEKLTDNLLAFFDQMLTDLYRYRDEICELLFDGRRYTTILDIEGTGDLHNHGKFTTIVSTDRGKLVYKPRNCDIDAAAYHFMWKYFSDIIVMPKTFAAGQRFGVMEFLVKKVSEGEEAAKRYYYALGGTTAVLKMFGASDMHAENLFACSGRLALVDIETLLYPKMKTSKDVMAVSYGEENMAVLNASVYSLVLFNQLMKHGNTRIDFSIITNTDELGSAPLVGGERRNALCYRGEFFSGFSDIYDRILQLRASILKDLKENFSRHAVRVILMDTRSYMDILKILNSRHYYGSEEFYAGELRKLRGILKDCKTVYAPVLTEREVQALLEGDVPFFYTYEGSRDIYADGELLEKDYFEESAIERAEGILRSLSEGEKQFEIRLMGMLMDSTPVKAKTGYPILRRNEPAISEEKALSEAEQIMEFIYSKALRFDNGDMTWLDYSQEDENCYLMNPGFYSGISGVAVFFAAMTVCSKKPKILEEARECLDSCLRMIRRLFDSEEAVPLFNSPRRIGSGEGAGIAGILRGIVLVNRICPGMGERLIEKARERIVELDASAQVMADKSTGLAGLIVTLCRYREYSEDPGVQRTVYGLARKLVSLRTLTTGDLLVWKTVRGKKHPISGAVHGMTGIAEALLMAGRLLETDEFEPAAGDALRFEAESYDETLHNWTDRRIPGTKISMKGNCYGTEGIGIVYHHLKKQGILKGDMPRILERADRAVRRDPPLLSDHLCCGNMSTVDYYLETGDREAAGRLLADVLKRKESSGHYQLGSAGNVPNDNVTLFYGLAGIGYELIRFTDPEVYETVL